MNFAEKRLVISNILVNNVILINLKNIFIAFVKHEVYPNGFQCFIPVIKKKKSSKTVDFFL